MLMAVPEVAVAEKVVVRLVPFTVAVTTRLPDVVPRVKRVAARPNASVVLDEELRVPVPELSAQLTETPERGVPASFLTTATRGAVNEDPTVADCPFPELCAIELGVSWDCVEGVAAVSAVEDGVLDV